MNSKEIQSKNNLSEQGFSFLLLLVVCFTPFSFCQTPGSEKNSSSSSPFIVSRAASVPSSLLEQGASLFSHHYGVCSPHCGIYLLKFALSPTVSIQ
jgi:hypothetical protein